MTRTPVMTFGTIPSPLAPSCGVVTTLASSNVTSSASPVWSVSRFVAVHVRLECASPSYVHDSLAAVTEIAVALFVIVIIAPGVTVTA